MKKTFKNFSFPYKTTILIFSSLLIFIPVLSLGFLMSIIGIQGNQLLFRLWVIVPTFFSCIGFIYCILGYHFQSLRGDELKLRIHLESLNIAFTVMLISFFILIFSFLNFWPRGLNWILVILAIIGILTYVIGTEFVKDKYK